MKFLEFHAGITKTKKIQLFQYRITKTMKFIQCSSNEHLESLIVYIQNHENHEIPKIPSHNNENHENLIIPFQNNENLEIHKISHQNHGIHEK